MGQISSPESLLAKHSIDLFDCGVVSLNEWLKRRALKNELLGASRTFVVCKKTQVIGYYALAMGSIMHQHTPNKLRRNMPDPIPVMVLGRLAVDKKWQSTGIGQGLLKDAVLRTLIVSQQVGVKALLIHTISEEAKRFYLRNGFIESPHDPTTLLATLKDIQNCLE